MKYPQDLFLYFLTVSIIQLFLNHQLLNDIFLSRYLILNLSPSKDLKCIYHYSGTHNQVLLNGVKFR